MYLTSLAKEEERLGVIVRLNTKTGLNPIIYPEADREYLLNKLVRLYRCKDHHGIEVYFGCSYTQSVGKDITTIPFGSWANVLFDDTVCFSYFTKDEIFFFD